MEGVEIKKTLNEQKLETYLNEVGDAYTLNFLSDIKISAISDGRNPVSGSICFVENVENIKKKRDVVYIVSQLISDISCVVVSDPRSVFIKFLEILQKKRATYALSLDKKNRNISNLALIHPTAILEEELKIGENTIISAGCVIKNGTSIGNNCIVRENTVIGCDGIAIYKNKIGEVLRFPHLASVIIGNNVEIGANSVVVRGTLKSTTIGSDVVIGNLCNIGHGVSIRDKAWLSVGTLVGGNSFIDFNSTLGLGVTIKDNITIQEDTSIGMGAVITKNTEARSFYFGNPAKLIKKIKTGPSR